MTTSRFISLLLLTIIASLVWWLENLVSSSQTEAMKLQTNRPDFYMEKFAMRNFSTEGTLKYQANGQSLIRYPKDDSLEIEQLEMQAFKQDKGPISVKSDTARISNDGEHILLTGAVNIHQEKHGSDDSLTLTTDKLFLDNQRDYIETNKPITIRTDRHTMHGTGMQAWLEYRKFRLLSNVRGTHEP